MIAASAKPRAPLTPPLLVACLVMGLTALVAQVVLTRELLALFYGNELSIALVLAIWLIVVAFGSGAGARLARSARSAERSLGWSQLVIAALLPASLLVARLVHPGDLTPGQVLGPGAMLLASLETMAAVCLAVGLQFALAARAAAVPGAHRCEAKLPRAGVGGRLPEREGLPASPVSAVAAVYSLEAAGAVIGGLVFHLWLARQAGPLLALALLGLLNLASAAWLLCRGPARGNRHCLPRPPAGDLAAAPSLRGLPTLALVCLLGVGLLALVTRNHQAELASLRASPRWSGLNPVAFASSPYGAVVITGRQGQLSFFQSGVLLFTSQDEYANEVAVHLPLLEHPSPRRVLVIGGALAGVAGEVLKHPVSQLDCVELDPRVAELARRLLPAPLLRALRDPRLHLHIGDGRLFVRAARARYDVIMVNLPDPTTAALNRFYTQEFFREAKHALAPDGILAIRLTGSEVQLTSGLLLAAASTDRTIASVFPERLLVPGERMLFLAASEPRLLTSDWRLLSQRLARREVSTSFVNDAWLRDSLLPLRADLTRQAISTAATARLNTDLNPISYYYQTRVWLDQLSPGMAKSAGFVSHLPVWWVPAPVALAAVLLALARGRRRKQLAVLLATVVMGAFGLVVEVLGLLAYQSARGYLYQALAGLVAAFMAGLAVGAALMGSRGSLRPALGRLLIAALVTAIAICLLLPGFLRAVIATPTAAPVALGMVLFLSGSLVGATFPIVTALYGREGEAPAAGGALYAADLVGSAGAALVAGVIAVPLLGVAGVSLATALTLAVPLVLALLLLRA